MNTTRAAAGLLIAAGLSLTGGGLAYACGHQPPPGCHYEQQCATTTTAPATTSPATTAPKGSTTTAPPDTTTSTTTAPPRSTTTIPATTTTPPTTECLPERPGGNCTTVPTGPITPVPLSPTTTADSPAPPEAVTVATTADSATTADAATVGASDTTASAQVALAETGTPTGTLWMIGAGLTLIAVGWGTVAKVGRRHG